MCFSIRENNEMYYFVAQRNDYILLFMRTTYLFSHGNVYSDYPKRIQRFRAISPITLFSVLYPARKYFSIQFIESIRISITPYMFPQTMDNLWIAKKKKQQYKDRVWRHNLFYSKRNKTLFVIQSWFNNAVVVVRLYFVQS